MFTAFSDDAVMVETAVNVFTLMVLPASVENPMEPDVIAATPNVDTTIVEPNTDDTTSVEGITTVFAESVEHTMFTAVIVDAVRIDKMVASLLVIVDPVKVE